MKRVLFLLIWMQAFISTAQIEFLPTTELNAEVTPNFMEIVDIDGDGSLDILLGSEYDFITLITSSSRYVPFNILVGDSAVNRGLAVGDFNDDDILDVAVTEFQLDQVTILLGDGNGLLTGPAFVDVGADPVDVYSVDYNLDDHLDLVVVNQGDDNISFLLNDGSGGFSVDFSIAVGSEPETVVLDLLNDDAFYDLVVTNKAGNTVSMAFGTSAGAFGTVSTTSVEVAPAEIQVANLDDDEYMDVIVSHDNSNYLSVFYGNSEGEFDLETIFFDRLTNGDLFAVTDIDEDELLDIVINTHEDDGFGGETLVIYNDGNRAYTLTSTSVGSGNFRRDAVAGVMTSFENMKFLITNGVSASISHPGTNSEGVFNQYREYRTGASPVNIAAGDLNNDGYADVVSTNFVSDFFSIFYYNSEGFMEAPVNIWVDDVNFMQQVDIRDIDTDGYLDIVLSSSAKVIIFYGNEDYLYETFETYSSIVAREPVIADVNKDGYLDIATRSRVYSGDGNRDFDLTYGPIDPNFKEHLAVVDLNGDDILDRIILNEGDDLVEVYLGDGSSFDSPINLSLSNPRNLTVGEFNGDGLLDLVVGNSSQLSFIYGGTTDDLSLENELTISNGSVLQSRDVNHDGFDDIITTAGSGVKIVFGEEDGSFGESQTVSLSSDTPEDFVLIDVDNNGTYDILSGDRRGTGGSSADIVHLTRSIGSAPIIDGTLSFEVQEGSETVELGNLEVSNVGDPGDLSGWSIINGNGSGIFSIDGSTGLLSLANPDLLDFDRTKRYFLDVVVNENDTRSIPQEIIVNILAPEQIPLIAEETTSYSIYPNPTQGVVFIQPLENIQSYSLIDAHGRYLAQEAEVPADYLLDMSSLEEGIYTLILYSDEGQFQSRIILK